MGVDYCWPISKKKFLRRKNIEMSSQYLKFISRSVYLHQICKLHLHQWCSDHHNSEKGKCVEKAALPFYGPLGHLGSFSLPFWLSGYSRHYWNRLHQLSFLFHLVLCHVIYYQMVSIHVNINRLLIFALNWRIAVSSTYALGFPSFEVLSIYYLSSLVVPQPCFPMSQCVGSQFLRT